MIKISITGKANSGKNTLSKLLFDEIYSKKYSSDNSFRGIEYIAFADPIKEMIRLMFPTLPRKYLYGPSKYRGEVIPGAFKDGNPLTVRNLLQDLGTGFGRNCKENIWLDAFDHRFKKAQNKNYSIVIVTDVRFRNEFDHLNKLKFYQIKLLRDSHTKINHSSEINQDSIKDNEFDYIVHNNGTLEDLKKEVVKIVSQII